MYSAYLEPFVTCFPSGLMHSPLGWLASPYPLADRGVAEQEALLMKPMSKYSRQI